MSDVSDFIERFHNYHSESFDTNVLNDVLHAQFCRGYCWHFATILQAVFKRGTVCWAWPFGHMVWQDEDGSNWDFNGEYSGYAKFFIPWDFATRYCSHMDSFIHFSEADDILTSDEIIDDVRKIGKIWCMMHGLQYDDN